MGTIDPADDSVRYTLAWEGLSGLPDSDPPLPGPEALPGPFFVELAGDFIANRSVSEAADDGAASQAPDTNQLSATVRTTDVVSLDLVGKAGLTFEGFEGENFLDGGCEVVHDLGTELLDLLCCELVATVRSGEGVVVGTVRFGGLEGLIFDESGMVASDGGLVLRAELQWSAEFAKLCAGEEVGAAVVGGSCKAVCGGRGGRRFFHQRNLQQAIGWTDTIGDFGRKILLELV